MPVNAAIFDAGVRNNIVLFQGSIQFSNGSVFETVDHMTQDICNRSTGFGFAVLHFPDIDWLNAGALFLFPVLGSDQSELLFNFLSGFFRLVAANVVSVYSFSTSLDICRHYMNMWM